jgi:catechol 2,3-dioxygenase-like lactoylglutathione lyase family enzyme
VIVGFDHVRLAARDVAEAARAYEQALGLAPRWEGASACFPLANITLRIDPAGPVESEGLCGLAFAVGDLVEARRQVERRGIPGADVAAGDGGSVSLAPDATHGISLSLAGGRGQGRDAAKTDPESLYALDHVVIVTPNPDRALALYGARLGLDLRLERSNPAWNARLFFFRCGDAVVEISADPKAPPADGPDRLSGLAWRARDPVAARRRIAKAGLDVSEVRAGRKAGTDVFTLRGALVGAPALVIGPAGSHA